ncbi:MAG: efflux RND transporter periplasmic adaptor subunit [Candidatus Moranbacteria bacterium]|nr:efflux RND transporter periplasmic adaptor subunit [Candidatus Moranbacteria bacterium]
MKLKLKKWQIVLGVVILVGGGYFWYAKANPKSAQIQYVTSAAEKGTLTTSVSVSGNIVVDQSVNIDPTITGTVSNLSVNVGDQVKKGQALFTIVNDQLSVSTSQAQTSFAQSQSSITSAEISLKQAKATYDADKKDGSGVSSKQKAVDKAKVDAAEQSLAVARQSSGTSNLSLQYQQQTAGKRLVVAPIDGTVNAVNVKNGDDLSKLSSGSSRTVPVIIGDMSTLQAQVQINEVDISNVQIGQKVMTTFPAIDGLTVSGKVEKMDSLGTVTQGVVTYNAKIGLDILDPRIKPGMSISASVITGVKQDVIVVPNSAIKKQGNTNYVQVMNGGSAPTQVNVEVGAANNTETEIVSGLKAGDKVVTRTIDPSATTSTTGTTGTSNRVRMPGGGFGG